MNSRLIHRLDQVRDAFGRVASKNTRTRNKGIKQASFLAGQTLSEMFENNPNVADKSPLFTETLGALYAGSSVNSATELSWDKTLSVLLGPIILYQSTRMEKYSVPLGIAGLAIAYYGLTRKK